MLHNNNETSMSVLFQDNYFRLYTAILAMMIYNPFSKNKS